MSDIRTIKRKIKSVINIQQICRAMKMVASVRIRNAERRMMQSKPFTDRYRQVVGELMAQTGEVYHPLMEVRPVKNTLLIIITSDKGLCGSYNSSIMAEAVSYFKEHAGEPVLIKVLGAKGLNYLVRRHYKIEESFKNWEPTFELAHKISSEIRERFLSKKLDRVLCLYSHPDSTMVQKPRLMTLLPLVDIDVQCNAKCLQISFEPPPREALGLILHNYLDVIVYQILLEANVAETGARLRAMTNATDNAEELIDELHLQYYRARQDAITTEILEVSGGAEALRQGG
ncbi:MAG: ATP synthase F1 subunit gamma [Chloroflexi bacterium]|nr:ATP synthase F1 subunit gamma [Chloroflexota bacterium]